MHSCSFYIIAALCINVKESKLIGKLIAVLWDAFKYSYIPLTNIRYLDVYCEQMKDTWLKAENVVNWMIFIVQITESSIMFWLFEPRLHFCGVLEFIFLDIHVVESWFHILRICLLFKC